MQRRSVIKRLAATVTGLSLSEMPSLEASVPLPIEPFSVTPANLAESSGMVTCPGCHEMADSLELTPAGLCLTCADHRPELRADPYSERFWILSPREVARVEAEIERLASELNRMNQQFLELRERRVTQGGDMYDRVMEAKREKWHALQRELHLLHLLRAASRQYAR